MSPMLLVLLIAFIARVSSVCNSNTSVDIAAFTAATTCRTNVLLSANTGSVKATGVCNCIADYYAAASTNCDAVVLLGDAACASSTIIADIYSVDFDFGASCPSCSNPPASPTFPSACSTCLMKYISCLTTGNYDLRTYSNVAAFLSLNTTCECISQFYNCFAGCGSPVSTYVSSYACNTYQFCSCDGSRRVRNAKAVIDYLKLTGFATLQANLNSLGLGIIVNCATDTNNNAPLLDANRFLCTITYTTLPSLDNLRTWFGQFLGTEVVVGAGTFLSGPFEVGNLPKRSEDGTQASQVYTFQVNSASPLYSTLSSLIFFIVAVLML